MNLDIQQIDCFKGLKNLESKSVDICITSPPYNLNINYSTYEDSKNTKDYLDWIGLIFIEIKRVLKDDGHLWVNMGFSNILPWQGIDVANCLRSLFILQNNFVWVKSISIEGKQLGHYKPINSKRFANQTWEHIFHFTKTGDIPCKKEDIGVPYTYKCNLKRTNNDIDLHCIGNAWFIPYDTICSKNKKFNHPAIFPEKLVSNCIKFSGKSPGGIILDPFLGIGTTGIVSLKLGFNFIGFEIDENYFLISEQNLTNLNNNLSLFN